MMAKPDFLSIHHQISVLVVDDSLVFRRVLRDILDRTDRMKIVGEAENGMEALGLAMRLNPDVIIMDMEMPVMDGMTSLQHMMICKPTPTIMVSSLTKEGTARSFDVLKCGAVDFISKDLFLSGKDMRTAEKMLVFKVLCASQVVVRPVEPIYIRDEDAPTVFEKPDDILFCEECGARNIFVADQKRLTKDLRCYQCGDVLEANRMDTYRQINSLTVIGAGLGSFSNLLHIIPKIHGEISGAIVAVVYAERRHIDAFADYLDAISTLKVHRMADGMNIEGGKCYIASAYDHLHVKQYCAHHTIRKIQPIAGYDPLDTMMISLAAAFKQQLTGIILSGGEPDGEKGMTAIKNNGGLAAILSAANCLCKEMGENILRKCAVDTIVDENDAAEFILNLHKTSRDKQSTPSLLCFLN